jgi:hypothetical protein
MARNYRRLNNKVPVRAMSPWILIFFIGFAVGMFFVFHKNEQHIRGAKIKDLERQLAGLNTQNALLKANIAQVASHENLPRLLEKHSLKMVEISMDRLVLLKSPVKPGVMGDELRAVSNGGVRR